MCEQSNESIQQHFDKLIQFFIKQSDLMIRVHTGKVLGLFRLYGKYIN